MTLLPLERKGVYAREFVLGAGRLSYFAQWRIVYDCARLREYMSASNVSFRRQMSLSFLLTSSDSYVSISGSSSSFVFAVDSVRVACVIRSGGKLTSLPVFSGQETDCGSSSTTFLVCRSELLCSGDRLGGAVVRVGDKYERMSNVSSPSPMPAPSPPRLLVDFDSGPASGAALRLNGGAARASRSEGRHVAPPVDVAPCRLASDGKRVGCVAWRVGCTGRPPPPGR